MAIVRTHFARPAVMALALLAGCATPGAPLPPSLNLPKPVADLRAVRRGDTVTLTWTPPREPTDKLRIRHTGVTRICRNIEPHLVMIGPNPALPSSADCKHVV